MKIFKLGFVVGVITVAQGIENLSNPAWSTVSSLFYLLIALGAIQAISSLFTVAIPSKIKPLILKTPIYFELFYLCISLAQTFIFDLALLLRLSCVLLILLFSAILIYALYLVNKNFSN